MNHWLAGVPAYINDIRNALNKIQTAYKFFSSHKRQDVLRDMQSQNEVDRVRSLKSHCDTRWSSWLAAVRDLRATLDSVYQSLIKLTRMIIQFIQVMQASWRVHYKHSVSSSVLSFFTEYSLSLTASVRICNPQRLTLRQHDERQKL